MPWAVAAAAVGAGATIYSANKASKASGKGADQSAAVQERIAAQNRADMLPWMRTGQSALKKLAKLSGVEYNTIPAGGAESISEDNFDRALYLQNNPDVAAAKIDPWEHWVNHGQFENRTFPALNQIQGEYIPAGSSTQPDYSDFYESPDYKFVLEQGQRSANAGLAARGLSGSGRALKELTRFGQGLASQQLNTYRNSLAALAGVGQTATNTSSAINTSFGQSIGQTYQNAADARASGYIATGNAVAGGISDAYGTYALMDMMKKQRAA